MGIRTFFQKKKKKNSAKERKADSLERTTEKEGIDEMAEQNLKRCDSICYKLFIVTMVVTAWFCAIIGHVNVLSTEWIGWIIVLTILVLTIIRTVIFMIMDSRGI